MYMNAIKERDAGVESLTNAKESLNRFEALVKQQVGRAMEKERQQHQKVQEQLRQLQDRFKLVEDEKTAAVLKNEELQKKI